VRPQSTKASRSRSLLTSEPVITRDLKTVKSPGGRHARKGKRYVVSIGVDRYRSRDFNRLHNAVNDARGAAKAFADVGFETRTILLDESATKQALEHLVMDDLRTLQEDDSLVLFFAGHGHTETHRFSDSTRHQTGYLIPADAEGGKSSTWIELSHWLKSVSFLPPKHILVILDACHSGIALGPQMRWIDDGQQTPEALERLTSRRSRRVITSALDDELAMDGGPSLGHSLFTGCLIETLIKGIPGCDYITGLDIGNHVKKRVMCFPGAKQTPDIGTFEFHNHGDLVVTSPQASEGATGLSEPRPTGVSPTDERTTGKSPLKTGNRSPNAATTQHPTKPDDDRRRPRGPIAAEDVAPARPPLPPILPKKLLPPPPLRSSAGAVPAALATALDRHVTVRKQGGGTLSMLSGESATTLAELGTWAARRGELTLVTSFDQPDGVVSDLLARLPWLRCLPAARACLAKAARLGVDAIDAAIDSRFGRERHNWINHLSDGDPVIQLSGWLLCNLRDPEASALDLATAPVKGSEFLAALGRLAAPFAIALHHELPTERWLSNAIATAAALTRSMPRHTVSVVAPSELVTSVLTSRDSSAVSMARQGLIKLDRPAHQRGALPQAPDLNGAEETLHLALARNPRTRSARFEQRVTAPIHERERQVEVTLAARDERLIVELDSWYHLKDPKAQLRQRTKDLWLARAGFFVMRFTVEDVAQRLDAVIDEIALGLVGRRRG
jgi:very-short-patch-repair endonuclease